MKTLIELLNEYHDMPFKVPMQDMGEWLDSIRKDVWQSATKAQLEADMKEHIWKGDNAVFDELPFPGDPT